MIEGFLKNRFPTTYEWDEFPSAPVHEYARISNPAMCKLESGLAGLEKGKDAFATASGQSALLLALSLLKAGDHVICAADVYDGTIRTLKVLNRFWLDFTLIAPEEFTDIKKHMHPNTRMVIVENPSSTLLNQFDITNIKEDIGDALLLVDSTVATPVFRRPLEEGADLVSHSLGKFIGGKDDLIGGALVSNDERLAEPLRHLHHTLGSVLAASDCALVKERLKTLPSRMKRHTENAAMVSEALNGCKDAEDVFYPGFSGVLSVRFRDPLKAKEFLKKVEIPIAQSYGGHLTRIQHPATMINSSLDDEMRKRIGLNERLVRIGVGLEPADEIIQKLMAAI